MTLWIKQREKKEKKNMYMHGERIFLPSWKKHNKSRIVLGLV